METLDSLSRYLSRRLTPFGVPITPQCPAGMSALSPTDRLALLVEKEASSRSNVDRIARGEQPPETDTEKDAWCYWFLHQRWCLAADLCCRLNDSLPDGTPNPLWPTTKDEVLQHQWLLIDLWRECHPYWLRVLAFDLDPMRLYAACGKSPP
jgi:hypothetical protein